MKFITKASSRTNNAYRTVLFVFSVSILIFSVVGYSTLYWDEDTNIIHESEYNDQLYYDELSIQYMDNAFYDDLSYLPDTLSHLIM